MLTATAKLYVKIIQSDRDDVDILPHRGCLELL